MSITTEHKNNFFFVRVTSDLLSHCDGDAIKGVLLQALATGTKDIVLSVSVGTLSNRHSIARLLRLCREVVRSGNGHLYCVERNHEEKRVYEGLCDSLKIPLYDSEEKVGPVVFSPVMA
jgi:hypothetical protein